jgi:tetratricopeptide (TPR) repeat protein
MTENAKARTSENAKGGLNTRFAVSLVRAFAFSVCLLVGVFMVRSLRTDAIDRADALAKQYVESGRAADAAAVLAKAIARAPGRASLHNHLGVARAMQGDRKGARDAFDRALALDPELAAAHGNRARLALEEGDAAAALRHARAAARLAPGEPERHRFLGDLLAGLHDNAGAADAYAAWAKAEPRARDAHLAWGEACVRAERYLEGARILRAARSLGALTPEARLLLGLALAEAPAGSEDAAEAERLLKETVAARPGEGRALYGLGLLAARDGRWNEAVAWFRGSVAAEPSVERPRYRLARALLKAGRRDEAARELAAYDRLFRARQAGRSDLHRKDAKGAKEAR